MRQRSVGQVLQEAADKFKDIPEGKKKEQLRQLVISLAEKEIKRKEIIKANRKRS